MSKKTSNGKFKMSKSTDQWVKFLSKKFINDGFTTKNFSGIERQMFEMVQRAKIPISYENREYFFTKKRANEREPLRKSLATPMKASANRRVKQSQTAIQNKSKSPTNDDHGNDSCNLDDNNHLDDNNNSDANANTIDYDDISLFHSLIHSTPKPLDNPKRLLTMGVLLNIGNSCYINAVLYALRFTPGFTHYIHHLEHIMGILADRYEADTNISGNMCNQQMATAQFASNANQWVDYLVEIPSGSDIIHEIHNIFTQLTASEKIRGNAVEPRALEKIREAVQKMNKIFTPKTQQDAHEFLLTILNSISDCSKSLLNLIAKDPHLCDGINNEPAKLLNLSYFKENFMGLRIATKTCTNCNTTTLITEEIIDVSATLTSQSEFNKNFIRDTCVTNDSIVDEVHCADCSGYFSAQNNVFYRRLPRFLIVQLCRFDNDMNKIKTTTPIPFTMKCFCTSCINTADGDSQHEYHLYGILVHVGEKLKSGHYISYVKASINNELVCPSQTCCQINAQLADGNPNENDWFICDDDLITPISQTELQEKIRRESSQKTPYVFFYARSDALQRLD